MLPQAGKLAARRALGDESGPFATDQADIAGGIGAEAALDPLGERRRMVEEAAIEILPGRQLVTPEMHAVDALAEADRIGDRNDDDLAGDPPGRIGGVEEADEMLRDEHRR